MILESGHRRQQVETWRFTKCYTANPQDSVSNLWRALIIRTNPWRGDNRSWSDLQCLWELMASVNSHCSKSSTIPTFTDKSPLPYRQQYIRRQNGTTPQTWDNRTLTGSVLNYCSSVNTSWGKSNKHNYHARIPPCRESNQWLWSKTITNWIEIH